MYSNGVLWDPLLIIQVMFPGRILLPGYIILRHLGERVLRGAPNQEDP